MITSEFHPLPNSVLNYKIINYNQVYTLTITLLEPKEISLCYQCTAHPCSLIRLYTVNWPTSNSYLDLRRFDNEQVEK